MLGDCARILTRHKADEKNQQGKVVPARGSNRFGELSSPELAGMILHSQKLTLSTPGWDPIFEYEGQTYAEMDPKYKVAALSVV